MSQQVTTTTSSSSAATRVILQPNRVALGARGEAANRVVRLVAAGGALKRSVRRKREPEAMQRDRAPSGNAPKKYPSIRATLNLRLNKLFILAIGNLHLISEIEEGSVSSSSRAPTTSPVTGSSTRGLSKRQKTVDRHSGKSSSVRRSPLRKGVRVLEEEAMGEAGLEALSDDEVGAGEWASERSWSPSKVAQKTCEGPPVAAETSDPAGSMKSEEDPEAALPTEAVSKVHDYVWKHFQGNGDDERLEIIAEVGQVLLEDSAKYCDKTSMLEELADLEPIIGGHEAVDESLVNQRPLASSFLVAQRGVLRRATVDSLEPRCVGKAGAALHEGNLTYNPSGSMTVVEKEKKMELEKKRVLLQCTESIRKLLSKMNEPCVTEKQKTKYKMMIKRIKETMGSLDASHHPSHHVTNKSTAPPAVAQVKTTEATDRKVLLPPQLLQSHNLLPATNGADQPASVTPTAAAK
ncbi:hypothetical protein FOL47_002416 [Perkinsus chesapeaki]|uniref:Uncharacterized protein n=1 Tax=Perkinsus chesapeaki TaxID=330153 RepID=A0A7J6MES7_PERCH|nr:hypothetical protein FOL47_002416 [Perkinsus chesapeaki]